MVLYWWGAIVILQMNTKLGLRAIIIFVVFSLFCRDLCWAGQPICLAPDAARRLEHLSETLPAVADPDAARREFRQQERYKPRPVVENAAWMLDPATPDSEIKRFLREKRFRYLDVGFDFVVFSRGDIVILIPKRDFIFQGILRTLYYRLPFAETILEKILPRIFGAESRRWLMGIRRFTGRKIISDKIYDSVDLLKSYQLAAARAGDLCFPFRVVDGDPKLSFLDLTDDKSLTLRPPFIVIKEKADEILEERIKRLIGGGNIDAVKRNITAAFQYQQKLWQRGLADLDIGRLLNNLAFLRGRLRGLDASSLSSSREEIERTLARNLGEVGELLSVVEGERSDLQTAVKGAPQSGFVVWCVFFLGESFYPEIAKALARHFLEETMRFYSEENFAKHWQLLAKLREFSAEAEELKVIDLTLERSDQQKRKLVAGLAAYLDASPANAVVLEGNFELLKGLYQEAARGLRQPERIKNIFAFTAYTSNLPARNFRDFPEIVTATKDVVPLYQYVYRKKIWHYSKKLDKEFEILLEDGVFYDTEFEDLLEIERDSWWQMNRVEIKKEKTRERRGRNPVIVARYRENDQWPIGGGIFMSCLDIGGDYERIPPTYAELIAAHDPAGDTIFDFSVVTSREQQVTAMGLYNPLALATLDLGRLLGKLDVMPASRCVGLAGLIYIFSEQMSPEKARFMERSPARKKMAWSLAFVEAFFSEYRQAVGRKSIAKVWRDILRFFFADRAPPELLAEYDSRLLWKFLQKYLDKKLDPFLRATHWKLNARVVKVVPNSRPYDIGGLGAQVYLSFADQETGLPQASPFQGKEIGSYVISNAAGEQADQYHQGLRVRYTSRFYAHAAQSRIAGTVYEGLASIDRCLTARHGYRQEPVEVVINDMRIKLLLDEKVIHFWEQRLPLSMLTEYLAAAIKQDRALMRKIRVLNGETLKLILLDKSPCAGADCQRNRLIGIPKWILAVPDNDAFRVLFQGVVVHELYHEASPLAAQTAEKQKGFEKKRLLLDVKLFFRLAGENLEIIKKITKLQVLTPEAPLRRALLRRLFLERIKGISIEQINCRVKPKRTLQSLLVREKRWVYSQWHPVPVVSQAEIARKIKEGKPLIADSELFQGIEPLETEWGLIDLRRLNRPERYREFGRFASANFVRDLEIAHYAGLIKIAHFSRSLSCSASLARALQDKLTPECEVWSPVRVAWPNWAVINYYLKIISRDENAVELYQGDRGQILFVKGLMQLSKLNFSKGKANLAQIFTAFPDEMKELFQWRKLTLSLAMVEGKSMEELIHIMRWRAKKLTDREAKFCRQLQAAIRKLKGTKNRLRLNHSTLPPVGLSYEECWGMKGWVKLLELVMFKEYAVNGVEGTLRKKLPDRVLGGFDRDFVAEMGWRYRSTELTKMVMLRQVVEQLLMIKNKQVESWQINITINGGRVRKRMSYFLGEKGLKNLQHNKVMIMIDGERFHYDFRDIEKNDLLAVVDFEEAVMLNWVLGKEDHLWKKFVPECRIIGANTLLVPEDKFAALHKRLAQVGCRTIVDLDSHKVIIERENNGQTNVLNQQRYEQNGRKLAAALRAYQPAVLTDNTRLYEFDHHFSGDQSLRDQTATSLVVAYLSSLGERRLAEELPRLLEAVFIQSHMDQDGFLAQWIIKYWEELSVEERDFLCAVVYYADNYIMRADLKGDKERERKIKLLNAILFAWLHQGEDKRVSFDVFFRKFMELFHYIYDDNPTLEEVRLKLHYFQDQQPYYRLATVFNRHLRNKAERREILLQPGVVSVDSELARVITDQEIDYLDCIEFFSGNGRFADVQVVLYIKREKDGCRVSVRLINGGSGLQNALPALNRREKELGGSADWGGIYRVVSCFLTGPSIIPPEEIEGIIRRELSLPVGTEAAISV